MRSIHTIDINCTTLVDSISRYRGSIIIKEMPECHDLSVFKNIQPFFGFYLICSRVLNSNSNLQCSSESTVSKITSDVLVPWSGSNIDNMHMSKIKLDNTRENIYIDTIDSISMVLMTGKSTTDLESLLPTINSAQTHPSSKV